MSESVLQSRWSAIVGGVFRRPCATILFLALALASTTPIAAHAGVNDGVREEMRPGEPGYQELALAFARVAKGDYEGALKYAQRARASRPITRCRFGCSLTF